MPKGSSGHMQLVMYAVFVSLLYAAFMMATKKKQSEANLMVAKMA